MVDTISIPFGLKPLEKAGIHHLFTPSTYELNNSRVGSLAFISNQSNKRTMLNSKLEKSMRNNFSIFLNNSHDNIEFTDIKIERQAAENHDHLYSEET